MDRKVFGIPLSDIITEVIYSVYALHELTLDERVELNNFIDDTMFQLTRSAGTCELVALQSHVRNLRDRLQEQLRKEQSKDPNCPGLIRFSDKSDRYKNKAILAMQCIADLIEKQLKSPSTDAPH